MGNTVLPKNKNGDVEICAFKSHKGFYEAWFVDNGGIVRGVHGEGETEADAIVDLMCQRVGE